MSTEARLVLAVTLMIGVIYGTSILFPPPPASETPAEAAPPAAPGLPDLGDSVAPRTGGLAAPAEGTDPVEPAAPPASVEEREIVVEGPLYSYALTTVGARLVSATLPSFDDLAHEGRPPVQLIPEGTSALGRRLVIGADTLDLSGLAFSTTADDRVELEEGGAPASVVFSWRNPAGDFAVEVAYTFDPASYLIGVDTRLTGVDRPLLLTSLGEGISYTEADSAQEARTMAYVTNRVDGGIRQQQLQKVEESTLENGPFLWTAIKSKYFVLGLLPGSGETETLAAGDRAVLGGLFITPREGSQRARVEGAIEADASGRIEYRVYVGPQEYSRMKALGDEFQEVNPYGWSVFRMIIRPFVGIIVAILHWAHTTLSIGYGWVLILFGFALRILLWPLNAKAMRAQIRNMAAQPLVKELQTRYKDDPKKMQEEMMKLYKEHGFNPVAGCLPMLLPWPVLIALFFVFQNAIELRGVSFWWLPDLSAKDPLFILPVLLALSMFLIQWITFRSMPDNNPQMKMMMWFMPIFLGVIFLNFPSGLNLYYASMNVATLPQQILIANERKKVKPLKPASASGGTGKKKKGGSARRKASAGD
ncbi:MAG: membrane protein insertase YidC [Longimicrobiales bacterium]|nr:membrane protein insertase YidC [Longimicrobiales bacterium]